MVQLDPLQSGIYLRLDTNGRLGILVVLVVQALGMERDPIMVLLSLEHIWGLLSRW